MANPEHVKRLKQGVRAWNDWREKNPGAWPNLDNADLNRAKLNGADLNCADLSTTNLNNADLSSANLSSANLDNTKLMGAKLMGADLSYAEFSDTKLMGADLSNADLGNADFSNADFSGTTFSQANLSGANLSEADLSEADLSRANLIEANLIEANLSRANLIEADLSGANLSEPDLSRANLSGADLSDANLSGANLSGANLSGADLSYANLSGANLSEANFYTTRLGHTIFARVDLCTVKRLDTMIHDGPSTVNINTVSLPEGDTRTHFLRGTGFSDIFIDYYHSLLTTAIQYASCFISFAHQDEALAQRLYKDLQDKGVRCWFASHDLRPGVLFHRGIEEAIHIHETVLLLLSEHAVISNWVAHEVEMTLNRQARERRDLLFPLRLDEAVLLAKDDWAVRLRESRHIGDFSGWKDNAIYQQRFADLLRHLKVKATK